MDSADLGSTAASQNRRSARSEDLLALRDALDQVNYGILLLDSDLRAHFINRAFGKIWPLPDDGEDGDRGFAALPQHGLKAAIYDVPADQVETYFAERLDALRKGGIDPHELQLH